MKNWIIFKNINSNTINGLLVCELPPISKPKMRVETTVIDGKDGDITDNLGYEAYDKTIKIGLTRDFDINKIIKYFSGEGEIIFSNEPNKVYIAKIISQIDYDRLLTFKIASIILHIQPFKYLYEETPTELEITTQTSLNVENKGLEQSKPILTLYGSGEIEIFVNSISIFKVNIDDEYIVIDSLNQEAYKGSTLKNRFMTGEFPILEIGINVITWTGNLTKIKVEPKSRWI